MLRRRGRQANRSLLRSGVRDASGSDSAALYLFSDKGLEPPGLRRNRPRGRRRGCGLPSSRTGRRRILQSGPAQPQKADQTLASDENVWTRKPELGRRSSAFGLSSSSTLGSKRRVPLRRIVATGIDLLLDGTPLVSWVRERVRSVDALLKSFPSLAGRESEVATWARRFLLSPPAEGKQGQHDFERRPAEPQMADDLPRPPVTLGDDPVLPEPTVDLIQAAVPVAIPNPDSGEAAALAEIGRLSAEIRQGQIARKSALIAARQATNPDTPAVMADGTSYVSFFQDCLRKIDDFARTLSGPRGREPSAVDQVRKFLQLERTVGLAGVAPTMDPVVPTPGENVTPLTVVPVAVVSDLLGDSAATPVLAEDGAVAATSTLPSGESEESRPGADPAGLVPGDPPPVEARKAALSRK